MSSVSCGVHVLAEVFGCDLHETALCGIEFYEGALAGLCVLVGCENVICELVETGVDECDIHSSVNY
jgi:hypothetical protein